MTDSPRMVPDTINTLAVFDICDTLYAQNTTFGFIRYLKRGRTSFDLPDTIATARWSPVFLSFAAVSKVTGRDHLRNLYLRCLGGMKRTELDSAADAYVAEILEPLALPWTHTALKDALDQGQTVCLASSSIDCVAMAIARRLGALCFSSKLEYCDDLCTGRLACDISGKKRDVILALPGLRVGTTRIRVFTDNVTDIDLVRFADEATIILPGGRGREKWAGCDVEFIDA